MSNRKKVSAIGSACFVVLLFLLLFRQPVIEVSGETDTYFIKEDEFTLGWIHSIEKEEWYETYKRDKKNIVLTESRFKTFGAGTPYEAKNTITEDGFIIMQVDITHPELNVTISEKVQTTLCLHNRHIQLYQYFDQYENVIFKVRYLPLWKYVRGDFL